MTIPTKPRIVERLDENANKLSHTFSTYKIKQISDDFFSGDNWISRDVTGAKNNEWIFGNFEVKPNALNVNHLLWHKDKVQDGKIRLTWENPKIDTTEIIYSSILFRAIDYKNYYCAVLFSGGSSSNTVALYQSVNGVFSHVTSRTLSTNDVKINNGVPISLEVEFKGSYVDIVVNGKKVLTSIISNKFNNGKFGIRVTDSSAYPSNLESRLSNFSAEEISYVSYPLKFENILMVGDSIALGVGATNYDKSWIGLFGEHAKDVNPNVVITNKGVGGYNTLEILNVLSTELNANPNKYDAVIISGGTNNTRIDGTKRRGLATTIDDVVSMIKLIKDKGAIPIIATPPNYTSEITTAFPSNYGADSYALLSKIVNGIRLVSAQENVRLVDNYSVFNNDFTLLIDGVHPNDVGYVMLEDNLFKTIYQS